MLGDVLRSAEDDCRFSRVASMYRFLALTGCRRSEVINLRWIEVDDQSSCLRLVDSKAGAAVRPIGLPARDCQESSAESHATG